MRLFSAIILFVASTITHQTLAAETIRAIQVEKVWQKKVSEVTLSHTYNNRTTKQLTSGELKVSEKVDVNDYFADLSQLKKKYIADFCSKPVTGKLILQPDSIHSDNIAYQGTTTTLSDRREIAEPTRLLVYVVLNGEVKPYPNKVECR